MLLACTLCTVTLGFAAEVERTALRAGRYVTSEGTLADGAVIVIEDGKIRDVLAADAAPRGMRLVEYPTAVLSPGLIDTHSMLTAAGQARESANTIEPHLKASDSFDPTHRHLARALRGGITSVLLSPEGNNLVSGTTALVKTGGNRRVPVTAGPLKMSLSPDVLEYDREPTSRAGAINMLSQTLATARSPDADPVLRALAAGRLTALVDCPSRIDVESMLALANDFPLRLVFLHSAEAVEVAPRLAGRGFGVVLPPYGFNTAPRVLAGAASLERAGVPLAFAGQMPTCDAAAIRTSAALAVRYGLTAPAARRAITIEPARVAGAEALLGSIEPGKHADLVVFSEDPLRLEARVVAVYIDGVKVFSEPGS